MRVEPYLNFNGRCDEAIEFYKSAIGAQVMMLMRFKDAPDPNAKLNPATLDKVMHSTLRLGDSTVMATDGHCNAAEKFQGISLSLTTGSTTDAQRLFQALADGGKITMPLGKTFFSPSFGMLEDRFGVSWMVIVAP